MAAHAKARPTEFGYAELVTGFAAGATTYIDIPYLYIDVVHDGKPLFVTCNVTVTNTTDAGGAQVQILDDLNGKFGIDYIRWVTANSFHTLSCGGRIVPRAVGTLARYKVQIARDGAVGVAFAPASPVAPNWIRVFAA